MLPLHDFQMTTLMDVDYARYVLNFERIELALLQGQKWRIHYQMKCSHLSPKGCELHGSDKKPMVCTDYNPYQCFYKRIFHSDEQPSYVRFNAERFNIFAKQIEFDEHRRIVNMPDISTLFGELPLIEPIPEPTDSLPDFLSVSEGNNHSDRGLPMNEEELRAQSCKGCSAWCCTRLLFPQPVPQWLSSIDHQRFLLGFPGVSLGYSSTGWTVVVQSRCRHLRAITRDGSACAIFGQDERPITCRQLSAIGCAYRYRFEQKNPPDFVHVDAHHLEEIATLYRFDTHGAIVNAPSASEIRAICLQT